MRRVKQKSQIQEQQTCKWNFKSIKVPKMEMMLNYGIDSTFKLGD